MTLSVVSISWHHKISRWRYLIRVLTYDKFVESPEI
jgi:hypothetical protein